VKKTSWLATGGLVVWIILVALGWTWLSRYENAPGHASATLTEWPNNTRLNPVFGLPTLVMFVHPQCPCSKASMEQLALIMARAQNKVKTYVVFIRPKEFSEAWVKSDLWKKAIRIPGVTAVVDKYGEEAKKFKAEVSGQTMLYNHQGHLIFSGGITSARGHQGDNDGQSSIISYLTKGIATHNKTPFFGCRLF
jgi:hypothetical protein